MATNISPYGPQPNLSVTVKEIEIITISDDEDNKEEETHIVVQSSLGSQKPHQDHNIPNLILDSFTNSQETSAARKSCIVQKRESVVRKLIETIDISDDEDDDSTHNARNSPESQKPDFSTCKSHQIPACLTSWKKQKTNLEEMIFGDPKKQEVTNESGCVPLIKSGNTVLNTYPDPEAFEDEGQHVEQNKSALSQIFTEVKASSSENRSKTSDTGHVTDHVVSTNSSSIVGGVGDILPNTSSWKMSAKKSCSGHRGAPRRKLIPISIEIRNILDDKDDSTSLESQKSNIPNPIPDTVTSWRKWRDNLDKKILDRTKKQGADLNLTRVNKSGSLLSSKRATISTDAVRKTKTLLTRKVSQRNIPANKGARTLVNSALNKVELVDESSDNVPGKSEAACGPPISMVTNAPVEQVTATAVPPEIASSFKNVMPSKLLAKDAVNAKLKKQKRRPTHKMELRKTTLKKCLAQEQQSLRPGDDSGAASILTTRKPLLRNQKQGQQRDRRPLLPHDKNLTRVIPGSGSLYYICNFCSKTFETHALGKRHVRVHTGDKPYQCSHCDQRFSRNHHVKEHQNHHADNQQFKCKFCTKIFLHWCSRRKHQNICANKKN